MIDLNAKYVEFIKSIISNYLTEYELFLFGSRAKGTAKKFSDIDLALNSKELTPEIKSKLEFEFENSNLPYEVDIVDLDNISKEFRALIEKSLIKL